MAYPASVSSSASSPASHELTEPSSWLASLVVTGANNISLQQSQNDQDRTGLDRNSPIFRRLLAGILYSRWLTFTYYGIIAAFFIIFVMVNWGPRLRTWHKSRTYGPRSIDFENEGSDRGISKGGLDLQSRNTSESQSSPFARVSEIPDEYSPLLNRKDKASNPSGHIVRLSGKAQSWFTYQPKSLPGFRNRAMPSNGTTVLMLIYFAISIFYLLFNVEFEVDMLFVFADRASQLFVTNLPILYILSAKNQPLQPLIGYSYASLNIVHRRLGEWMCFLAAFHSAGMIAMWATLLYPSGYSALRFFADRVVLLGIAALVCYEAIYLTSLASIRQQTYELFLATHILLQVGALVFLFFHQSKSQPYVLTSVAIWVTDRIVYRLYAKSNTFKAALTVLPDGSTTRVSVSIPLEKPSLIRKGFGLRSVKDGWQTLDHVFLSIPVLGHGHVLQSHPFSIASMTPAADASSADLDLIIRARDGFSKDLLVYAAEHDTASVRIDGPYGAHSASRSLRQSDARIIVAGGSGIAVTCPLLDQVLKDENSHFDDVEHATHTEPVRPILFVWVVHCKEQWSWIDLDRLRLLGSRQGVEIILPEPTDDMGRPDVSDIMRRWVDGRKAKSAVSVVVSGPDGMSREVRNECASLQARGLDVHVEVEKYGW